MDNQILSIATRIIHTIQQLVFQLISGVVCTSVERASVMQSKNLMKLESFNYQSGLGDSSLLIQKERSRLETANTSRNFFLPLPSLLTLKGPSL